MAFQETLQQTTFSVTLPDSLSPNEALVLREELNETLRTLPRDPNTGSLLPEVAQLAEPLRQKRAALTRFLPELQNL